MRDEMDGRAVMTTHVLISATASSHFIPSSIRATATSTGALYTSENCGSNILLGLVYQN